MESGPGFEGDRTILRPDGDHDDTDEDPSRNDLVNEPLALRKVDLQARRRCLLTDVRVLRAGNHLTVRVVQGEPVLPRNHNA